MGMTSSIGSLPKSLLLDIRNPNTLRQLGTRFKKQTAAWTMAQRYSQTMLTFSSFIRTLQSYDVFVNGIKESASKVELVDYNSNVKYPTSFWRQLYLCTKRALTKEWRDMATNRSRILGCLVISFILGTLFLQLDNYQVWWISWFSI